jgi:hypothetical protein
VRDRLAEKPREDAAVTDLIPIFPQKPVPALQVPLVGGGRFDMNAERPPLFTMLVFYRGYHCAQCQLMI